MNKLYRFDEVPLSQLGLNKESKREIINTSISDVIKILINYGIRNLSDDEIVKLFYKSNTCRKIVDFGTGWHIKYIDGLVKLFIAELDNDKEVIENIGHDEYIYKYKGRRFTA